MRLLSATDILNIRRPALPMVVLSDNLTSWFAWRIRQHTHGHYNHAMWMIEPSRFASQNYRFKSVPCRDYLTDHHRLKFWHRPDWTEAQRALLVSDVRTLLRAKPRYDWWGIVGQRLRIPGINFGRRYYCSEAVARTLRLMYDCPEHPSPAELNEWLKQQDGWEVYGVYDPDLAAVTEREAV